MLPTLEHLYRRLMLAYPADYRRVRGDEIAGTLLEGSRADQRLPSLREAIGLLLGGVRTRARSTREPGRPGDWADSLRLAGALLVGFSATQAIPGFFIYATVRPHLIPIALALTAIALLRGIGRWGLALLALDVFLLAPGLSTVWPATRVGPLVAPLLPLAVAAAAFVWSPQRHRARLRWPWWFAGGVAAGPALLSAVTLHGGYPWLDQLYVVVPQIGPAVVLAAAALVSVDPRPALGGAIYLVATALSTLVTPLPWLLASPFPLVTVWAAETNVVMTLALAALCFGAGSLSSRMARRV